MNSLCYYYVVILKYVLLLSLICITNNIEIHIYLYKTINIVNIWLDNEKMFYILI